MHFINHQFGSYRIPREEIQYLGPQQWRKCSNYIDLPYLGRDSSIILRLISDAVARANVVHCKTLPLQFQRDATQAPLGHYFVEDIDFSWMRFGFCNLWILWEFVVFTIWAFLKSCLCFKIHARIKHTDDLFVLAEKPS